MPICQFANLPIRAEGYQWDLYLPGTSSDVLWTEYLPPEKLPQVLNPPSGFIQNANSSPYTATVGEGNPDLDNFSITFGIEKYEINRALMMKELFVLDESISFEEFKEYKFNLQYHQDSDVAQAMEMLSDLSFKDTQLIEAQEFLANWDLGTGIENKETALGLMTMLFLSQNVEDFVGHMLARNEFSPLDVELAFTEAVEHMWDKFGKLDPEWGEVQRLQCGAVDVPMGGGPDVVRAAYSTMEENGQLIVNNGDGFVMLIAWRPDGSIESYSVHQFGSATIREESSHFDDQSELLANMELKPVWFEESDILENLEIEYTPWTSTYH
ncbi:MAG: hypothetical protein HON98_11095 [Chloroflexi bacterium]|nr:hypothetical protein [Chloroflexota bacterium]MBT5337241.1 hypothetical protein [Chloroflexota bacterium]MBT6150807.1 hypothetical protein [Chloroflexota bacterium]MBT6356550.1 hypothetical protein [Chloroflexota bacterium]MBT7218007.1 hypothetical protein [Chloroflexota bacterium]